MRPFPFIVGVSIASAALVLSTAISAGVYYLNIRNAYAASEDIRPERVFGIDRAAERMTVVSVDPYGRTLTGMVRIPGVNQEVPTRFDLSPDFVVWRRDPIIRKGAVVGTEPTTVATLDDLVEGTRGFGVIRLKDDGHVELSFLVIGDPFPRP